MLAGYGPSVTAETQAAIEDAQAFLTTDAGSPFVGPVLDQDGTVKVADGVTPDYAEIDAMDYFVQGVVGDLAN